MKPGEVWRDVEDGQPIKIDEILYSLDIRDYLVYYEDVEEDWGTHLPRVDFLTHFEFFRD